MEQSTRTLILFLLFFPSVQKKKEKEKQKRSKERFQKGDYCNQQTFIAFHGKLEISDEWN